MLAGELEFHHEEKPFGDLAKKRKILGKREKGIENCHHKGTINDQLEETLAKSLRVNPFWMGWKAELFDRLMFIQQLCILLSS